MKSAGKSQFQAAELDAVVAKAKAQSDGYAAEILRNLGFTSDELHETVKTEITKRSAARGKP